MTVVPAPPTLSNVAQGTLFYRKHGNENVKKSFDIKLTSDKKAVCRQGFTDITFDKIESFYHCISYLRNQCCHYQRFYRIQHVIALKRYSNRIYVGGLFTSFNLCARMCFALCQSE